MTGSTATFQVAVFVPRRARMGAAALIALVAIEVSAAVAMMIVFGVTLSMSLMNGWREHADIALWCAGVMASVALYLPGRHRRIGTALALIALPTAIVLMIESERQEGALLFGAALLLHGSVNLARTLSDQARRLSSPLHWIERRLLERRCPRCLYDLRHLRDDRCPECGFEFAGLETLHADAP